MAGRVSWGERQGGRDTLHLFVFWWVYSIWRDHGWVDGFADGFAMFMYLSTLFIRVWGIYFRSYILCFMIVS